MKEHALSMQRSGTNLIEKIWWGYKMVKLWNYKGKKIIDEVPKKTQKKTIVLFSRWIKGICTGENEKQKVHIHKNKQNYITQIIVTHSILF